MEYLKELVWLIGGPQGSGVDSSASTFAIAVASGGYHIFGSREYHSNIMGEHSYYQIRASEKQAHSPVNKVHILATFENETLHIHQDSVLPGGAVLYDEATTKPEELKRKDVVWIPIHYMELIKQVAVEFGREKDTQKLAVMRNVLSVSASLAILEYPFEILARTVEAFFKAKKPKLAKINVRAAEIAYNYARDKAVNLGFNYRIKPIPTPPGERRILLNGSQAAALGKIVAGCRFQTYYPITPASDESEFLESHPEFGVVVVQCEDEISSICMAVGGAETGVRASTATSGPGFCLMVEGMGWSGINEVPVVIYDYQRAGPSTGLPTRFEQGDLKFALYAGHGDFPRIVMAPGDTEEYFYFGMDAFNYAERYQCPVIFLLDKNLANSTKTVSWFDPNQLTVDRGALLSDEELLKMVHSNGGSQNGKYKRFQFTESGISPRAVAGQEGGVFWNTGDEHNEYGHITEDPMLRLKMMEKRMGKLDLAEKEIPLHKKIKTYGASAKDADCLAVTWGSMKGPILDVLADLEKEGIKVRLLQMILMSPFPVQEMMEELNQAKLKIGVEMNYSAQLCGLIREKTGVAMDSFILKWTGRAMTRDEVRDGLRNIVKKHEKKVVLTHGA
jgi:2-oxoglutarate ferredoxin oxidoreductase subunit alpha